MENIPHISLQEYILGSGPHIRMLLRAFVFSSNIYTESMDEMQQHLKECQAFLENTEGKLQILKWK